MSRRYDSRPAIHVSLVGEHLLTRWAPFFFGLEEEGIPHHLQIESGEPVALAHGAAQSSLLGVGVTLTESEAVVHSKNCPREQPLFREAAATLPDRQRILGSNSARLVKGLPFK